MPTTDWMEKLGLNDEEEIKQNATEVQVGEASYRSEQAINLAKNDLNFLAGLAIPTILIYLFPNVLLAAWTLLTQKVDLARDFSKIALGIPRGFGKTTLIKLFVLYCILFTKKKFILVIGRTGPLAENILADIIDMLNEPNIIKLFGSWRIGLEVDRQDLKKFAFRGRPVILAAIGAEGSVRGLNVKNERPDVIIFEDIQDAATADSKIQSDALEKWMIGTAMKARSPHGCLYIFAGNMFPTSHSILKKLKKNKNWIKFISGAVLADGTSLWPEHRSVESLIDELDNDTSQGHPEIFFSEVLNDTSVGINTKFDATSIKPWPWAEDEIPQGKVIIIDPASGKNGGDLIAIGYFEIYDAIPGLKEVIEESLSPGNCIRRALLMGLKTGTRVIAVEATAYQATLLYWFDFISQQLGITGFYFVPVNTGMASKNSRITTALKSVSAGEIILHSTVKSKVLNQIANWNPMKRDNVDGILDLLAHCSKTVEENGALMQSEQSFDMIEANSSRVRDDNHAF